MLICQRKFQCLRHTFFGYTSLLRHYISMRRQATRGPLSLKNVSYKRDIFSVKCELKKGPLSLCNVSCRKVIISVQCKIQEDYYFSRIWATSICETRHLKNKQEACRLTILWTEHGRVWRDDLALGSLISLTWISLFDEESIRKGLMSFPLVGFTLASDIIFGVSCIFVLCICVIAWWPNECCLKN